MDMNIIDIIIIGIMAFSLVSGMHKGFITSTLALVGFCGAWIGAYASYGYLVTAVQQNEGLMNFLQGLVSAADLFKTKTLADMEVALASAADVELAVSEVGIPLISDLFRENVLGHAEVRQTIHVPNVGVIAGSYVQDGKITRASQIRVVRDGVVIFEDKISSLRRFKDDVREVAESYECGIGLDRFNDIKVGDILEAFVMEEIQQ
jgi:hypothetical protein